MGNCPWGQKATHIAVPLMYNAGAPSNEKTRELKLRSERGPWAARRFGACTYAQPLRHLPQYWDWVAQSLCMFPPPLFENLQASVHAKKLPQLLPSKENAYPTTSPKVDMGYMEHSPVIAALNKEVIPSEYDLMDRHRPPRRTADSVTQTTPASEDKWKEGS